MYNHKEVNSWAMILIRLCIMLFLLSLSRWLLYIFNADNFVELNNKELIRLYFIGFRFDLHTLLIFNIPLIIGYGLPIRLRYNRTYRKIIDISFIITNSIAIALNLIDVIYFRYLDKRMSSELFTFFTGTDEDQFSLILHFIIDFWYMFLIFFIFLFIIIVLTKIIQPKASIPNNIRLWHIKQSIIFIIMISFSVIGIRGGFQLKPINLLTAIEYTSSENTPLVINTPFSICMSSTSTVLDEINYFDHESIDSLYSPCHKNIISNRFIIEKTKTPNVVLIILESFGQEMIGYYNDKIEHSNTPFLDSLFKRSLTFDGFANGRRSIEALPSILCGIPSLMATDLPSSRYAINRIDGFGNILKDNGYTTSFFHGGNNGTMSFNTTSKSSGFDYYYGRDEYNNDSDYDGTWGIYDGPFLQYMACKLNDFKEPFAATVFTLSSHHPYSLPENYAISDTSIKTPFEKTIRYVDEALNDFFATASKQKWFENTIFIITADHVNPDHYYDEYKNIAGSYRVPIAFYAPQFIENKESQEIAQHLDIGVSILAALGINDSIISFGRNLFDSIQQPEYISYLNNIYQFSDGEFLMQSDGKNIFKIYDIKKDIRLKNNIYNDDYENWAKLDKEFKIRLQQYNNRMINNKLYIKR